MFSPFGWKKTEYANPGAMNYAFVPNMTLPALGLGGSASLCVSSYSVLQHPQVVSNITVPTNGYGGLVAGQLIGQPLSG
jgi:hypothetical protein